MTSGRREGARATFGAGLLACLVLLAAPAVNADRTGVPASTCTQQANCLKARIKLISTCTYQVCLFWNPGQGCQVQPTDKMERVCTRQSTYVRWYAQGLTTATGETCSYEDNDWEVQKPVCDTVRCGETAYFNLRDGGSCAAGGEALIRDKSDTYDIKCSPPGTAGLPTPCAGCNGGSSDACTWSWTAPGTLADALAIVEPKSTKCRCTPYEPKSAAEWLCSSTASCPNAGRRLLGLPSRDLKGLGQCAPAYTGTPSCWLRENWNKVLKEQGRGNTLKIGDGDRVVSMDLTAIENMCSAWSLSSSYQVPTKTYTPPAPVTCPTLDDPNDPAPNCTVPSWKYTQGSGWATTGGTYEGKGPTSCSGTGVGKCCSDLPNSADCPTSSCHANDLGDVEMNCPNSANCPVRDSSYQATCVKLDSGCGQKCLGYVNCAGAACPDWQGTACFYLGSSNNWKVCSSASCNARGSNAPLPKAADDPSPDEPNSANACTFGKFVWNSQNSKFDMAAGITPLLSGRCNQGANALCQSNGDCAGNCCGGQVGKCPTSSCHANGLGTEERNCPNSARCPFNAGNAAQCVPAQPSCRTNNEPHCLGYVNCTGTACPDWQGTACFYNGVSNNWKVCSDTTCAAAPAFPTSNLDQCDSVNKLLDAGAELDPRAKAFCEYPNWRNSQNGNTGALTGHTGRCTSSNPADCHGNCEITTTGKCPTSSCIANALGDENLNCPRSARCPVRTNNAECVPYVASCRTNGEPHCIGRVQCNGAACPDYEGMDCFYNGVSDNWKICWSGGCYANGNTTVQATEGARVKESKTATGNTLPTLAEVGGDQFLATLAATLNVYKDRIDNKGCSDEDNDPLDSTVIPPSKECGCYDVKGVLRNAHSALSDLLAHPYTTATSDALPLGQVQKCLERINSGGNMFVPDVNDNNPKGLVFDEAPSTCTPRTDPTLPAPVAPNCQPLPTVTYTFATPVDTAFTASGAAQSLLKDVVSQNPSPVYGILNVASQPTNNGGTVTVQTGGGFTFTPAQGFSGTTRFCATTFDGCTTGQACVDMAVGGASKGCATEVSICMPLKTPSAGAKCPPKATLGKLADAIKAAIKGEPGATPDVKDTSCDYLNPTTVMATFKVDVATASCSTQAAATLLKNLDVDGSACSSKLLAGVCNSTVDGYRVDGGSATQGPSCLPPELVKSSCVVPQTFGAFVTTPPASWGGGSRSGRWIGCCCTNNVVSKCKRIRVGQKFQDGKTKTMNPLKQLKKCKDYIIREEFPPGAEKNKNGQATKVANAAMPFSLGVASNACVPKANGKGCSTKWLKSAATAVECKAGAPGQPGTLVYNFASAMGNIVRSGGNIVATCDSSVINGKTCKCGNQAGTIIQHPTPQQTTVSSPEWDENCVCKTSGRRPAMRVEVPSAVVGAACKP